MRKLALLIISIAILSSLSLAQNTYVSPVAWVPSYYTGECAGISGRSLLDISGPKSQLSATNKILQKTKSYNYFNNVNGTQRSTTNIFDIYVQTSNVEGTITTTLIISNISHFDGSKTSQTATIGNDYQFIDADGPFCLIKQTIQNALSYSLYYFDKSFEATSLLVISITISALDPNIKLTKIFNYYADVNPSQSNLYFLSPNYDAGSLKFYQLGNDLQNMAALQLTDITSSSTITIATGFDDSFYINDYLFLKIQPPLSEGNANYESYPHGAATSNTGFVNGMDNYISTHSIDTIQVLCFRKHMIIGMINTYQKTKSTINVVDYWEGSVSFLNLKIFTSAQKTLQQLTDHHSFIIQYMTDNANNKLIIIWGNSIVYNNYHQYINQVHSQCQQIVQDLANSLSINGIVKTVDTSGASDLYLYLYEENTVTKYTIQSLSTGAYSWSITINKEFSVSISTNLQNILANPMMDSFEVSTIIQCWCVESIITNFICFYGTDQCTFTVQSQESTCNPISE